MSVDSAQMTQWCRALLGAETSVKQTLPEYLDQVGRLESLADLPAGTPVLVRGDVDAKPGSRIGDGDVRLRSMVPTLQFGRQKQWKQIIFGHIGRKPEGSLAAVAARLGELLECEVPLVSDWYDEASGQVLPDVALRIAELPPGGVLMLENTRKYNIERLLWKATPENVAEAAEPLVRFVNEVADKIAHYYVNEAFSAGSLDTSSTVVPIAMQRCVLGKYVAGEFDGPMRRCLQAELVVFSGLKADKLDDLSAMIERGTVRVVFTAGSLAMALKKADAQLSGTDFSLGLAEAADHADKPYFVEPRRIEQAREMLTAGRKKGIRFVLPIDFVLDDGTVSDTIPADRAQMDIGPKSSEHFAAEVGRFLAEEGRGTEKTGAAVAFYNGVFGKFEDPQFEQGTKRFIAELKRMLDAGVEVYVGGGEGGAALEKYGQPDWVTHCFTAGGTVLNALGSEPVPYLVALAMSAKR